MKTQNLTTGKTGEVIAARYLQNHGFHIIDHNWKIKLGEIDIVAVKNNTTYFIEVKTQYQQQQTVPEDELTKSKISKLKALSQFYSMLHPDLPEKLALSAICVLLGEKREVKFYENLLE